MCVYINTLQTLEFNKIEGKKLAKKKRKEKIKEREEE